LTKQSNNPKIINFLKNSDDSILELLENNAINQSFPKGTYLTMEGDKCHYFPIIKKGIIRVYKTTESGHEITLYRINPGESCILTVSCLLSNKSFPAIAYVEEDCDVMLIASNILKEWIIKYEVWRNYIFNYITGVLTKVIGLIEDISFKRIDIRIIEYLINMTSSSGNKLKITHSQIANDIGTAREVVSRCLKLLEKENILILGRGKIKITNLDKLQKKINLMQ
jgi:CRP/FNR family transcriptional regulator